MTRLDDDTLVALFCGRWDASRDLAASLRFVVDAAIRGPAPAIAKVGAELRKAMHPPAFKHVLRHAYAVEQSTPILEAFARGCGLVVKRLTGRETGHTITRRRYECMWVLKKATDMSYPEIGAAFKRGHDIAIRGVRETEARIASDEVLRARLEAFVAAARSGDGRRAA